MTLSPKPLPYRISMSLHDVSNINGLVSVSRSQRMSAHHHAALHAQQYYKIMEHFVIECDAPWSCLPLSIDALSRGSVEALRLIEGGEPSGARVVVALARARADRLVIAVGQRVRVLCARCAAHVLNAVSR